MVSNNQTSNIDWLGGNYLHL